MPIALILGASRGIGQELARQYVQDGWRTLATARRNEDLAALKALGAEPHALDVAVLDGWTALRRAIGDLAIDVAVYNAGIFGSRTGSEAPPSAEAFDAVMHTNVLGAMHAIEAIAPSVERAQGKFGFISSGMGSLSGTTAANGWTYRASKAALNAVVHSAAFERKATLLILSPGGSRPTWAAKVRASMSKPA